MYAEILDKEIETLSFRELRAQIVPKLERQLNYILSRSGFYQKKLGIFSVKKMVSGFAGVPFTEKHEIIEDQTNSPPFGSNVCADFDKIARVHRTSGTTAKPVFLLLTSGDINSLTRTGRRCFWSSGLRPDDMVVHCLNYCLWTGGYTDHQSLEATGAAVVPYGVGNSRNLIQTILDIRPTAIHSTPSYLARLEVLLKNEFKMEPSELRIKKGFFGGEPGLQNVEFRNMIEKKWGMRAMNANYGLSDVHSMFGAECSARCGLHFMGQEYILPEIIDLKTERILPIAEGVRGELVLTNIEKEAQPLIRFRTHDVIEILGTEPCGCGRTSFRFKVMGRSDDMLIIKGVNLFPNAIADVLSDFLRVLSGEFQVIAPKKEPLEKIGLNIELNADKGSYEADKLNELRNKILERICHRLDVSPDICLMSRNELPRTEGKTRRVIRT